MDIEDFPSTKDDIITSNKNNTNTTKKKKKSGGFQSMGLNYQVLKGILTKGYKVPTPIQRKVIPMLNQGSDVVAMARTGSGKTAAFLVPMFQKLKSHSARVGVRALILSPTRELALQTMKFTMDLGRFTDLRACVIVGGDSMDAQFTDLARNPDIIVATPGRLLHHLIEVEMQLNLVEYIVFDEADRLFEMGFSLQIEQIMSRLSEHRQTVLMSATMPRVLVDFAQAGLHNPILLRLDTETKISENLSLSFLLCRSEEKIGALVYLLNSFIEEDKLTIVFTATRHHVEYLQEILRIAGVNALPIYGNMDQVARKNNLQQFRRGNPNILVVTDVAARGLDVPLLDNVINFDFPGKPKLFIHRVGRAARAGRIGTAYSLVSPEELPYMIDLHLFLGKKLSTDSSNHSYGRIPQHILDYQSDNVASIIKSSVDLTAMTRVVTNAYKLYFKTRSNPSPESVQRAKEITPPIPIHSIFLKDINEQDSQRINMVESLKEFRPQQTIMEFRQRNRLVPLQSRIMPGTEGNGSNAMEIMKKKNYIHGGLIAKRKEEKEKRKIENKDENIGNKRKFKGNDINNQPPRKKKKKITFKDDEFYMDHTKGDEFTERGLSVRENFNQSSKDIILDLMPDEKDKLNSKSHSVKWDRKKKKFIGQSTKTSSIFGTESRKSKIRNESGQLVNSGKKANIYKEWQRKSKLSIQRTGEEESSTATDSASTLAQMRRVKRYRHKTGGKDDKIKDEIKTPQDIAKARKTSHKNKQTYQRKQNKKKGKPNIHPAKTKRLRNKPVNPTTRVKAIFG